MTKSDEIAALVARHEDAALEFQRSLDLAKTARDVAAMLNSGGGTIVIGVGEKGDVVGVRDPDAAETRVKEHLAKALSPPPPYSVRKVRTGKRGSVLVIDVPAGNEGPYASEDTIYLRRGSATAKADATAISRLIRQQLDSHTRWERQPALGVELADLDLAQVRQTASLAADRRLIQLGDRPEGILEYLNLRESGRLSNGAVVLFGKDPTRWFPQTRVRAARFEAEADDVIADLQMLGGHIFALLEQIEAFLRRHLSVRATLPKRGIERDDRPSLPMRALREALLNALAHRDYAAYSGGVRLGVWDDRIELWNSGGLPAEMSPASLKLSHPSLPRNPTIAYVLYLRGLVEGFGLGTTLILREMVGMGLPEPSWIEVGGGTQLDLRLRAAALTPDLHPRELGFLARQEPGTSFPSTEYEQAVASEVSARQARTDLKKMVAVGFLRREGKGRATRYVRTAKPVHG